MRIAGLLPSSLQTLELHTVTAQQEMPSNILHMLENPNMFPSWSDLCIYGWATEVDKVRLTAACQQREIQFSILPHREC